MNNIYFQSKPSSDSDDEEQDFLNQEDPEISIDDPITLSQREFASDLTDYTPLFIGSRVITSKIWTEVQNIRDETIKKNITEFASTFEKMLAARVPHQGSIGNLPLLSIAIFENQSAQIEWNFKDFRFGFSFDKPPEENIWFFVSNKKYNDSSSSGDFDQKTLENVLENVLNFVVSYS